MEIKNYYIGLLALIGMIIFTSCEEEFIQDNPQVEEQYVVESQVEVGPDGNMPAYVILTKSVPYFQTLSAENLQNGFVRGAEVVISSERNEAVLDEVCLSDLTPELKIIIKKELGIDEVPDSIEFCIYIDLRDNLDARVGDNLTLKITHEGNRVTAQTSCVAEVPVDSFSFVKSPGVPVEGYRRLLVNFQDPGDQENFYRYKIAVKQSAFQTSGQSVADDKLVNGKQFSFPLMNPKSDIEDFNDETFGLFEVGDSITVQWISLGQDQFDFWYTLENSSNSAGPFSSYSRLISNIDGGLGIFGASTITNYPLIVKE